MERKRHIQRRRVSGQTDIRHRRRLGDRPETKSPTEMPGEPAPERGGHQTARETEAADLGARGPGGWGWECGEPRP